MSAGEEHSPHSQITDGQRRMKKKKGVEQTSELSGPSLSLESSGRLLRAFSPGVLKLSKDRERLSHLSEHLCQDFCGGELVTYN